MVVLLLLVNDLNKGTIPEIDNFDKSIFLFAYFIPFYDLVHTLFNIKRIKRIYQDLIKEFGELSADINKAIVNA